jgi:nicotinate-nucleotide pyrophosphorylase (carboxylating)
MNLPQIDLIVRAALEEDLGAGDITSGSVVPAGARARGVFVAKAEGVLAGLVAVGRVFALLDPGVVFEPLLEDGARLSRGMEIARIEGPARSVLSGERTALNFLQRLSGVASATARVVAMLEGTRTRLLDTRKTTPGMRALEKAAVRAGGGTNHRVGLFDAVMIKNNHLKFASPAEAIRRARAGAPATACVEVEVENFDQLREALEAAPDIVMLDNMGVEKMREALSIIAGRARVEVSGNVTEETLPGLCDLGVDFISMGALTHSSPSLDLSLRVTPL